MTPRATSSRHALESCTLQLHSWRPFDSPKPYSLQAKKPCRSDRSTAPFPASDSLDLSRLSLLDDPPPPTPTPRDGYHWISGKRRRRQGSRSISGRSSDRSGTRRRGGGASAAYATCSDFPLATDSSGELFANGDGSWGSDASEAARGGSKRDARDVAGGLERESSVVFVSGHGVGISDSLQGNESGYGSEPGYRGDAEFGDEFDEEEDDRRIIFWGDRFGRGVDHMEIVGENRFLNQKSHHRGRRKKQQQGLDNNFPPKIVLLS